MQRKCAHDAAISRVSSAHPEFGTIIPPTFFNQNGQYFSRCSAQPIKLVIWAYTPDTSFCSAFASRLHILDERYSRRVLSRKVDVASSSSLSVPLRCACSSKEQMASRDTHVPVGLPGKCIKTDSVRGTLYKVAYHWRKDK